MSYQRVVVLDAGWFPQNGILVHDASDLDPVEVHACAHEERSSPVRFVFIPDLHIGELSEEDICRLKTAEDEGLGIRIPWSKKMQNIINALDEDER